MKKSFLLLVAAIGLSTAAKAQVAVASEKFEATKVMSAPFESVEAEQNAIESVSAPMRGVANGIWYKRPTGTYLQSSKTTRYMIVPPFTELIWTNMSTNPEETKWKYGNPANGLTDYKESLIINGNYVNRYSKNTGTGAYYGPFVCVEDVDTFAILDSQVPTGYPLVIAPEAVRTLAQVPQALNYNGFTDLKYGYYPPINANRDGTTDSYQSKRLLEYFDAPAKPLYLESISFYAALPEGITEPIAAGSEGVTCHVVQVDDEGKYTDTISVIPINPIDAEISEYREGYYTTVTAFCMEEDELGGLTQKPVVIEKDFRLAFEGFTNEGVQFAISMTKVPVEEMYNNGGAYPTVYETYWTSDGAKRGNYYQYNATNGTQYNMVVRLNGMWDVVAAYNGETAYYASAEGGEIYSLGEKDGEEVQYPGLYIQSVFPYQSEESPMPSYSVEGLPDWLSITGFDGQYYTADYGFATEINIEAQPLPAGVEGREAKFYFVSDKGAKSEEFTVTQGNPVSGINEVTNEQAVTNHATFNLSGQLVGGNYRGIVIKNGKKVVRK